MAPLKFEEKMKEKLEQRAIKPSENSWEQLANQLDDIEHQKKGFKKIWWYGIAAIFIGTLMMIPIFQNNNPASDQDNNQFVDVNHKDIKQNHADVVSDKNPELKEEITSIDKPENKNTEAIVLEQKNSIPKKTNNLVTTTFDKENFLNENTEISTKSSAITIVKNDDEANEIEQSKETTLSAKSEIIDDKIANVVAQIEDLQKNNIEVTDEEIDRLLRKAQREITAEKILKSNTVSASALLQDVEQELDETFKQRVFEALKTGFQKVKTAVVEREN